jgi:hypothetical protein
MDGWINGRMDGWINGREDRQINGREDRQINGRGDGRINGRDDGVVGQAGAVVAALVVRATVRITGVAKNTIVKLLVEVSAACTR